MAQQIKPSFETFARIKVVGVGGAGGNALMRMISSRIQGVEFVAVNTDFQDLHKSGAPTKLQIGKNLSRGLGAGMNPEVGRQAATDAKEEILEALKGADMVFITAGLGGGTGTGASPIVAEIARDIGALTVAIITKPFAFEGAQRTRLAEDGWRQLGDKVDAIITIPNDRLLSIIDRKTPILEAFAVVDDVLRQGVQGISDLITVPGIINVDFADVKTIMKGAGSALLGIGVGVGENRAQMAARAAISSPLLDLSIDGAKGVLFNITGGPDLTMFEVDEAARAISGAADPDANIIFGNVIKEDFSDQVRITVIATGFDETQSRIAKMNVVPTNLPKIQGVVSEPSEERKVEVKDIDEGTKEVIDFEPKEFEEREEDERQTELPKKRDEFGEDFEVPAFLRKIH